MGKIITGEQMSNHVASLELCRTLHELSGWRGTYFVYSNNGELLEPTGESQNYSCPAYDLGYLLRKLPATIWSKQYQQQASLWQRKDSVDIRGDYYFAFYFVTGIQDVVPEHGESGKTPEDTTTKLAIELFKQGILTKEKVK